MRKARRIEAIEREHFRLFADTEQHASLQAKDYGVIIITRVC